jgi:hypothetical protein
MLGFFLILYQLQIQIYTKLVCMLFYYFFIFYVESRTTYGKIGLFELK